MITALRLGNFKAFAGTQTVPVRPLTLLFGANSAGKSSIIHGLALAHHALEAGDLDVRYTRIGGESIDLGGFGQYVHLRNRAGRVEWGLELATAGMTGPSAHLLRAVERLSLELTIAGRLEGEPSRGQARDFAVRIDTFTLAADGYPFLKMSIRPDGRLRLDRLDHEHPILRQALTGIMSLSTTARSLRSEDFERLAEVINRLVPQVRGQVTGLLPQLSEELEAGEDDEGNPLVTVSRGQRNEDLERAVRLLFPKALRELVDRVTAQAAQAIRKLDYLGPLRSYPPRHLAFSEPQNLNWLAGGGFAWDVVRQRRDVRDRVNEWLGSPERLKTPYELVVRDLVPGPELPSEIGPRLSRALHDLTAGLLRKIAETGEQAEELVQLAGELTQEFDRLRERDPDILLPDIEGFLSSLADADTLTDEWTRGILEKRADPIQDLVLIDKRSLIPLSHRDVGIGVSQVLPVLVHAYAARDRWIAIEQPEIHLHPALQAELGDVFLESALGDQQNRFLIETHSEHLILRILRRIRETTDGELPEGAQPVTPDQVAVLYVQPTSDGAQVIHIPVTEDGDFAHHWPEGFFAERARELF
jgi:AAA ATPase domain